MMKTLKWGMEVYKRIITTGTLAGGLLMLPLFSHAQGGDLPCGGDDPTSSNPCPLDTWVWIIAVTAVILGVMYLQRKQKLQNQA